ncbi:MAG TPA: DUF2304 domain-containing protein [Candidatus Omnitrophota bacterium]|nr:DUF2304 domain-containing protein [Candidatus Omnitrophota bacterium]
MQVKTSVILISLSIFLLVIDLIRRQKITFRYSFFWLFTCAVAFSLGSSPALVDRLSSLAGFTLPSNFVFFLLLSFFIILSLLLTLYINEQNSRTEILAQKIAILEQRLKKSERQSVSPENPGS